MANLGLPNPKDSWLTVPLEAKWTRIRIMPSNFVKYYDLNHINQYTATPTLKWYITKSHDESLELPVPSWSCLQRRRWEDWPTTDGEQLTQNNTNNHKEWRGHARRWRHRVTTSDNHHKLRAARKRKYPSRERYIESHRMLNSGTYVLQGVSKYLYHAIGIICGSLHSNLRGVW